MCTIPLGSNKCKSYKGESYQKIPRVFSRHITDLEKLAGLAVPALVAAQAGDLFNLEDFKAKYGVSNYSQRFKRRNAMVNDNEAELEIEIDADNIN